MDRFSRCKIVFGEDGFERISRLKILIVGVGGVGSYLLDCLYRSGVSDITIIDFDRYDITNQNRQIGSKAVGEIKVKRLKELYPSITPIEKRLDIDSVREFDFEPYDMVVDACDTTSVKVELAKKCGHKLIMAMGSAKRVDPTKIRVDSIWKTHNNPLAKKVRYQLRKESFRGDFLVVYSFEDDRCKDKGSFVAVTGSFGLFICAEIIKRALDGTKS